MAMSYKSKFTGKQIDDYLDVVSDLAEVAISGSYNDLKDKPENIDIDPELLEVNIPLSRDFSDDFNNSYAR
jgi:hypothetical protein